MKTQIRQISSIPDYLRLIRVEDYVTFVQLVIGYFLAGGRDVWYLSGVLIILAPMIYGGLYTLNDIHDVQADRLHPLKRTRPIAAGRIPPNKAFVLAVALILCGLLLASVLDPKVLTLAILFIAINLAYTFLFKPVPYLEIFLNTITHPLRFAAGLWLAGGWGHWPLLAVWFSASFAITTLKRIKELHESSSVVRPVLRFYSKSTLKAITTCCMALLLALLNFLNGWDLILGVIWFCFTLVSVVGYFRIPAIKRLAQHLWR